MKKNILIIVSFLMLIFSLAACGNKDVNNNEFENKENVVSDNIEIVSSKKDDENIKEDLKEDVDDNNVIKTDDVSLINVNDFNKEAFLQNCDFVHVISEGHETSVSEAVEGIQVQKLVYNIAKTHEIFVNSEVDDSLSALMILRVGTNKISDIERINSVEIVDVDKDLYTIDVIKTPCCHYYVFKLKMPLVEENVTVGFGIDTYMSYYKLSDMKVFNKDFTHNGGSFFTEGGIANLENGSYIVSRNERELVKDVSTENEHIALKQAVIELIPLTGTIKMEQLDNSKWHVRDLTGKDLFEIEDDLGGMFTYTITTVSPEYRNQYNNNLVHSVYVTYKYINEKLTGEELEKQMNKIISNSIVTYINEENQFFRNFVIN